MKPELKKEYPVEKHHGTGCNMSEISFYAQDSESGCTYSGHKYVVIESLMYLFSLNMFVY